MLTKVGDHHAQMIVDGREYESDVKLEGVYNLFNAAAALAVVRAVQADLRRPNAVGYAAAQLIEQIPPAHSPRALTHSPTPTPTRCSPRSPT